MLTIKNKLDKLREQLSTDNLYGFIVPHADEYLSEYTPACAERLEWITGFTGSSGMAVILEDTALALTDSRYAIQIKEQVEASFYEIADMAKMPLVEWIKDHVTSGHAIGYDPQLHTQKQITDMLEKLEGTGIDLKPILNNPIDVIWKDRPSVPQGMVELFPDKIAGQTSHEKRQIIADKLKADKVDAVILTASDSICWLLNVRGEDVPYNPVVLCRAVLHAKDATLDWFVDEQKLVDGVLEKLGPSITVRTPDTWFDYVQNLTGVIQLDPQRSPFAVLQALEKGQATPLPSKDPCVIPKACKTEQEQLALRQAHIRDGLAVTRFLYWLDNQNLANGHVDEVLIAEKLEDYRRSCPTYRGQSFATIAGWKEHGAIIHYHATPETNSKILDNGLLLLDSGGQYEYGTTDITRTIVLGQINDKMREHFTRCLKGHIAVATAKFDDTAIGSDIDKLARVSLLEGGVDYGHSTGHGVGCFLCVHEDAAPISPRGQDVFKAGMLISNEPGCYIEGQYGIRHENLMLCQEDEDGRLFFDTVTLVPFDLKGINWDLMTVSERNWLVSYHRHVFDMLVPFLDEDEIDWLKSFLI